MPLLFFVLLVFQLGILLQQIESGGISLTEPPRLVYEDVRTKVKPQRPWDVVVE